MVRWYMSVITTLGSGDRILRSEWEACLECIRNCFRRAADILHGGKIGTYLMKTSCSCAPMLTSGTSRFCFQ